MSGKSRGELGSLSRGGKVSVIVDGRSEERVAWIDDSGQKWVKVHGKYWKYPEQVER